MKGIFWTVTQKMNFGLRERVLILLGTYTIDTELDDHLLQVGRFKSCRLEIDYRQQVARPFAPRCTPGSISSVITPELTAR